MFAVLAFLGRVGIPAGPDDAVQHDRPGVARELVAQLRDERDRVVVGRAQLLRRGAQIIGPHFSEARILNVAHQFQQATDWHTRMPPAAQLGG